jgi:cobalt-zinc-cadmium efflux system membrane fusion protein
LDVHDSKTSSSPTPKSSMTGRQQWLILAIVAGVGLAGAGLVGLITMNHGNDAPAAAPADPGVFRPTSDQWKALTLAPVQARQFDREETADGKIAVDDERTTQVYSPFSGQVVQVFAQAGQHVAAHAPLFAVAANEIVQGRGDLTNALGALATANAQLKLAQETEARQGELYRTAGGALKDWRQAQSDLIAAQGQVRSAEGALGAARSKLAILGQSMQDIKTAEQAPAASAVGARTTVYAPVAGVVVRRNLGPGQNISTGGDPLFAISDLSSVWLVAQVAEGDAALMHPGATFSVTTPAWPGRRFTAKVTYVAPELDADTHRLPVRATIANPDGALKPEMFARFRIVSGPAGKSPAAPEEAVIREGDSARVWVASSDGTLRIRPVTLGVASGGLVQVTSGLKPGESVVAKGALFVDHAGQPN